MTQVKSTSADKKNSIKDTKNVLLNISNEYLEEKYHSDDAQRALLNILDDFSVEKINMENTHRAVLNILEDYGDEKQNLEKTQTAILNILEDYSDEKQKVESVNNDLIHANKELEQFAYVSSHDLQEPLRTIYNFVNLLAQKNIGKIDKDSEDYLQIVLKATAKMQQLIRDLLEFSQVGRNLSFNTVDCNEIFKDVIADLDASIKENNAKITSAVLPILTGNATELMRLFQNLISNAIKYQKNDISPVIEITVKEKDNEYLFAIKDNGIGIEEQFIHKLFIIFQRLHSAGKYPGTGIGLATCKKIVSLHKGEIWVKSKFGEGSIFYFTIAKKI